MSSPTAPAGPGWWRPLRRSDQRALLALVAIPTLLFAIPALFGHPAIAQDNLIQNFPLRVLSGHQLAGGHLPLLNSLANSGTPLLGGMNAGSFYPLSLFFVVLPPVVAWVATLAITYASAAVGLYALARWHGLRSSAAFLGAIGYAFMGAMMGQLVHLAVVEGYSLLPWAVLTELVVARALLGLGDDVPWRDHLRRALPGVIGLSFIWALTFLSGEPRAIAELELLTLVVVVVELIMHSHVARATWRGRSSFLAANLVGLGWGAAIGLIQLVTGWAFIAQSQRAALGYSFFGSGSLRPQWSVLLFIQEILGGNGVGSTPSYFTNYNLAEVTGYGGVLALCAVIAFALTVTRRGWIGSLRPLTLYGVLLVVGLFATWGSFTWAGYLFHALPLFGKTRLQSRNIVIANVAEAVLLAWWLDALFSRRREEAAVTGWRRYVVAAPAFVVLVLSALVVLFPVGTEQALGAGPNKTLARDLWPILLVHSVLALIVLVAVLRPPSRPARRSVLVAVVALDVLAFNVFANVGLAGGHVTFMPTRESAVATLGDNGRYALIDPTLVNLETFESLGVPNMNVFTKLPSIQGYGSLVSQIYGDATGTHPLASLDPCEVEAGRFRQLRLGTLVLASSMLARPVSQSSPSVWCQPPTPHRTTQRFFGQLFRVNSVTLTGWRNGLLSPGPFAVRLLDAHGQPFGTSQLLGPTHFAHVRFFGQPLAAGFQVISLRGVTLGSSSVTAESPGTTTTYVLDSAFEQALTTAEYLKETTGVLSVFHARHVRPTAWVQNPAPGASVKAHYDAPWGDQWISVSSPRAFTLVRSSAWLEGWKATATNVHTGATASVQVRQHDLVQAVRLPAGAWSIHFHYHAPYIVLGLSVSVAATLALLAVTAAVAWRSRRRFLDGFALD